MNTNSTPTPPPSVPQGMREAIARLENDAFACEVAGYAVHYYGSDKVQLAKDIRLLLAALAPHVAQAIPAGHEMCWKTFELQRDRIASLEAQLSEATPPSLPAIEGKTLGGDEHARGERSLVESPVIPSEPASRASSPTAVLTRAKEALEAMLRIHGFCTDETPNSYCSKACANDLRAVHTQITALLSAPENKEKPTDASAILSLIRERAGSLKWDSDSASVHATADSIIRDIDKLLKP